MAKIRPFSYSRKDKIIGYIEIDGATYRLKETHSSKNKNYKIRLEDSEGNKVRNIFMNREGINRLKAGLGMANIDFQSEQGFLNFFENIYGREFNEKAFREMFGQKLKERYSKLEGQSYIYYEKGKEKIGTIDGDLTDYIEYLVGLTPSWALENIYRTRPNEFKTVWKYRQFGDEDDSIDLSDRDRRYHKLSTSFDAIKAEIENTLNGQNIEYMSFEEFKNAHR